MKTEVKKENPKYRATDPGCIRQKKISDLKQRLSILQIQEKTRLNLDEARIVEEAIFVTRANKNSSSFFQYLPSHAPNRSQSRMKAKFKPTNFAPKKKKR